jgi:hypothetical protein
MPNVIAMIPKDKWKPIIAIMLGLLAVSYPERLNSQETNTSIDSSRILELKIQTLGDSLYFQTKNIGNKPMEVPNLCLGHNRIILITPEGKEHIYNLWVEPSPNDRHKSIGPILMTGEARIEKSTYQNIIDIYSLVNKLAKGSYKLYWKIYQYTSNTIEFDIN